MCSISELFNLTVAIFDCGKRKIVVLGLIALLMYYVQVTKLCDLGIDDCVCSVGWAQRGTHLAVGTSNGKVQVRVYVLITSRAR